MSHVLEYKELPKLSESFNQVYRRNVKVSKTLTFENQDENGQCSGLTKDVTRLYFVNCWFELESIYTVPDGIPPFVTARKFRHGQEKPEAECKFIRYVDAEIFSVKNCEE